MKNLQHRKKSWRLVKLQIFSLLRFLHISFTLQITTTRSRTLLFLDLIEDSEKMLTLLHSNRHMTSYCKHDDKNKSSFSQQKTRPTASQKGVVMQHHSASERLRLMKVYHDLRHPSSRVSINCPRRCGCNIKLSWRIHNSKLQSI